MRFLQRFSTFALLTVYGATALLGYGLHMFDPHGGHHHALARVSCAGHSHEHNFHEIDGHGHGHACHSEALAAQSAGSQVTAACCDEACAVCEFLAQARSAAPNLITAIVWHHVASEVVDTAPQFVAETAQGLHVPRGPPLWV